MKYGCRLLFAYANAVLVLTNRPGLAELGRFACRWLLERIGFLQGGEAFPAHGTVGLQGQGDRLCQPDHNGCKTPEKEMP